jgi:hypothetical protein
LGVFDAGPVAALWSATKPDRTMLRKERLEVDDETAR